MTDRQTEKGRERWRHSERLREKEREGERKREGVREGERNHFSFHTKWFSLKKSSMHIKLF